MDLKWIKNPAIRDRVGLDLLLCGNGFVVEDVDGRNQKRVDPANVKILSLTKTGSPIGVIVSEDGKDIAYPAKHVWRGQLQSGLLSGPIESRKEGG